MATRADLLKLIGSGVDQSTLTDQELQSRLQAFQDLTKVDSGGIDTSHLANDIATELQGVYALDKTKAQKLAQLIAQKASDLGRIPNVNDLKDSLGGGKTPGKIQNALNAQEFQNKFGEALTKGTYSVGGELPTDIPGSIKTIQDLQANRAKKAGSEAQLQSLLTDLPAEQRASTDKFIVGEQESAKANLETNLLPEILQGLNVRGIAQSGDLESELAAAAAQSQGTIQDEYATQLAADDAFFQNAAYQVQLQKSIDAGTDITSQVASARADATAAQKRNFQASQKTAKNTLSDQLLRKQQQRQLDQQKADAQRKADADAVALRNQLISTAAGAAGTVVGSAVGGPAGGFAGQQVAKGITTGK